MTHKGLIDRFGNPMRAEFYRAAGSGSRGLQGWYPPLVSQDRAMFAERRTIAGRIHDIVRNDGWASGALQKHVDSVVGAQWRLSCKPHYKALGLSKEWAAEFARVVEGKFHAWSEDPLRFCDAARQTWFPGLVGLMYRHFIADGETLVAMRYLDRGGPFKTAVQIVEPERLCNPFGKIDDADLRQGVKRNRDTGEAMGYYIRKAHEADVGLSALDSLEWTYFDRETEWGRPACIHFFEARRAGQTRGESWLAPILEHFRNASVYNRAEIEAAIANAIQAYFVVSEDPEGVAQALSGQQLSDYQKQRLEFHKESDIEVNGTNIPILFPNEDIRFPQKSHPNATFPAFMEFTLRAIATATGQSYEQVAMDWSKTNYSSARAALAEVWKHYTARRGHFAANVVQPIYLCFLEEVITANPDLIPKGAPSFYEARALYARAKWIGPARGYIDPTKEIDAANARVESMMSTLEDENADQSRDLEETLDQLAIERDMRVERGLIKIDTGLRLAAPDEVANQAEQDRQADARPENAAAAILETVAMALRRSSPAAVKPSALQRVATTARSPEHNRAIDERP
jgi:lambda family phage portal protein